MDDDHLFQEAAQDRVAFWAKQAQKHLHWYKPWSHPLEWNPPFAKWFVGGKLNASHNCLDRHMTTTTRHKVALLWEGEQGEERKLTYEELLDQVGRLAQVLKDLSIQKGDKIAIYLPQIPEAVIAMLACARIGAVHTVIFAGFSIDSLKDRIQDAKAKLLITADGGFRKGKVIPLKAISDESLSNCPSIQNVIVIKRTGHTISMQPERDLWYHTLMKKTSTLCSPEEMDAEDPLYILYTSGTTGKPKGIVHTTGGYMTGVTATMQWVFDIRPDDIYWCTADVGWVTGHSYIVYGPLSNGMTVLLYEGAFDFPDKGRTFKLIEKYGVTILYTAPTLIRTFMKWGASWPNTFNLSSLRLLGSVGEPINPEAWMWYHEHIGQNKCPIVDTWWQTETGSIMISPIPGITKLKPGSASKPLPGIDAAILDEQGNQVSTGYLAITSPWPSMLRGIHNDPERYINTYWKKWEGLYYFTGDGAILDHEDDYFLMGRVDDVINVSGHRLGTAEIESALVDYKSVAEAAVIATKDEFKGQAIIAFVTLKEEITFNIELEDALKHHVSLKIGAIARPERIIFIYDLPKTRSGKIMRRLLRDIAEGSIVGDITTLADPLVIEEIKIKYQED